MMPVWILLIAALASEQSGSSASGGPAARTVALVESATCSATVKPAGAPRAKPVRVKAGTYLYVGDELRCTSTKGQLTVRLDNGQTREITAADNVFVVKDPIAVKDANVEGLRRATEERVARVLRHHGDRAGSRGGDASVRVVFPVASAVVRPQRFVIRWAPALMSGRLRLSVWRLADNQALWTVSDVDPSSGALDSAELKKALAGAIVGQPDTPQTFVLQFADDKGTGAIPFQLLPPTASAGLDNDLAVWDKEKSALLRRLGRAYAFDTRKLFHEAAEEYRAAFELTGSCDMVNEAIAASRRAQDAGQVRQLSARRNDIAGCDDRYR
jgi:hypothetical protein